MGHELHSFQMQGPTRYNLEQIRYIYCDSTLYVAVVSGIQPKKTQPFYATGQEEDLLWSVFYRIMVSKCLVSWSMDIRHFETMIR